MVKIREIEQQDFSDALNCIQRSVKIINGPHYPDKIISYQLTVHYTPEWMKTTIKDKYFIVAVQDNQVVGTGALKDNELRSIFVDPFYQNEGVGRIIVQHLEQYALSKGYTSIFLESSITAVRFYEKLGYYKIKEETIIWLEENVLTIHMIKLL